MISYLYHFQIGFPSDLERLSGTFTLNYSRHALNAACDDRYGGIALPEVLDTSTALLVEAEARPDGSLLKAVYRVRYNWWFDLVLVVNRDRLRPGLFVRTVWLNRRGDKHHTLDRRKYAQPVN